MARRRNVRRRMDSLLGLLNTHQVGRLFLALMRDRRVPIMLKVYATCGLIYFFSPLDVIPHDFTGVGLVDDLIIAVVVMQAFLEVAPAEVVDEHCASLGIKPEAVFGNVPEMVQDAMEMFYHGRSGPWSPGYSGAEERPAYYYPPPGPPPPGAPAPPFSRYSAYRGEEERG